MAIILLFLPKFIDCLVCFWTNYHNNKLLSFENEHSSQEKTVDRENKIMTNSKVKISSEGSLL
jgi:hypothetical protein